MYCPIQPANLEVANLRENAVGMWQKNAENIFSNIYAYLDRPGPSKTG